MFELAALIIKYRSVIREFLPVIRAILGLIGNNRGDLDKLVARPDTRPDQDAREFLRKADERDLWDEMSDYG